MVKALVLYHSGSGNTGMMADAVAEGLKSSGADVTVYNTKNGIFDIKKYPDYNCIAVGSPDYFSYVAGELKTFMDDWYINRSMKGMKDKPFALFYNHGGGGRVKESMENLFKHLGKQIGQSVGAGGRPDKKTLDACKDLGVKLAQATKA